MIGLRRAGGRDDAVVQHRLEAGQAGLRHVGRSGKIGERRAAVTANARILPSPHERDGRRQRREVHRHVAADAGR